MTTPPTYILPVQSYVDATPIQAILADHEARIAALESGSPGPGPGPSPGSGLAIGMWYADMGRFPDTAAWGFTHVHEWAYTGNGSLGFLDAAHAYGLKVCLELSWAMGDTVGQFDQSKLDQILLPSYVEHPALWGWGGWDEPDLRGTPVGEMQKFYDAIRRKDSIHPIKCTIRYPFRSSGAPYVQFPDVVGVDPYMINYGPAEQCGDETAQTVAVAGGKPVCTDVQTFSWATTFSPPGRIPTIQEVEVMGQTSLDAMTDAEKILFCYLEDELVADSGLRNGIDETVTRWKASQGVMTMGAPQRKVVTGGPWKPLPKHPAIDAAKLAMKAWKRRHYPRPA